MSSFTQYVLPNIYPLTFTKLDGHNYLNWTTQIVPDLYSHELLSTVDGSEICPSKFFVDNEGKAASILNLDYIIWQKKDQFIFHPFIMSFSFTTMESSISFDDFQTELINFEQLLDAHIK